MHAPVRTERVTLLGRLAREPLIHFLLIGLLLFVGYGLFGRSGGEREIRIDEGTVKALEAQFTATLQRPPTAIELHSLVDSYVRDEIFYREGAALGLDREDAQIKRRVRQKYEVLAEETEVTSSPSDADLNAWLKAHSERYADPALITFEQVLVEAPAAPADVNSARAALAAGLSPEKFATGRMILPRFELYPIDLVERDFGPGFARRLLTVPQGGWVGPIRSGYGIHLVRVEKLLPGRVPPLDRVRKSVARDFESDRRSKAADAAYRRLRESYKVTISAKLPDRSASP